MPLTYSMGRADGGALVGRKQLWTGYFLTVGLWHPSHNAGWYFRRLLSSFIGTFVGLLAGYKGGKIGEVLAYRGCVSGVANLAVIIVLSSYMSDMGLGGEVLIIGFFSWLMMARSIRSQTLTEAQREYVDAARAQGMGSLEIMFKEILPNILGCHSQYGQVITQALLTEASMSFLGLGDAAAVSWGKMLSIAYDNSAILHGAWWWMIPPGLCIATLGFSFMLIGNRSSISIPMIAAAISNYKRRERINAMNDEVILSVKIWPLNIPRTEARCMPSAACPLISIEVSFLAWQENLAAENQLWHLQSCSC